MESKARKPKKGETQIVPRLGVQTQGKFREEGALFKASQPKGDVGVKPKGACFNYNEGMDFIT
jgi:hypothetical protein